MTVLSLQILVLYLDDSTTAALQMFETRGLLHQNFDKTRVLSVLL
jgi:hypothetical protein